MKTRTLTAPTIHAALAEARQLFGDEVVLLESFPPQGDQPARITIMTDEVAPVRRTPVPTAAPARAASTPATAEVQPLQFGYGTPPRRATARTGAGATGDGFADGPGTGAPATVLTRSEPAPDRLRPGLRGRAGEAGRGRLFQPPPGAVVPAGADYARPSIEAIEKLFEDRLKVLHERLDQMDRRFESAIIGAGQRWTSHPLFRQLLDQGLRPATLTRLFDRLADAGIAPDEEDEPLRWAVAQELRRMLDATTPRRITGPQVFVGAGGTGKTSLVLKLARHPGFFGRHRTAVLYLLPEDEMEALYHNPVDLYRRFGLPVQAVQTEQEMERALQRVQHFDQLLIDTPPLPTDEAAARRTLLRFKRLLGPIVPLHVHWVVDATRALDHATPRALQRLPLAPDGLALTHLDETRGWGRVAEWLMTFEMPVQYATIGPRIPDGALAYSPTWFIEQLLNL